MRDLNTHYVKWQVSLSNGETLYEDKGDYEIIPGQESPWQRLQTHLSETGATITSLSLYTDDGRTFNLPSAGKNPKFAEFAQIEAPLDFDMCRKIARETDMTGKKDGSLQAQNHRVSEWFTIIKAIYEDYTLEVWVDELNINNCWSLVKENK